MQFGVVFDSCVILLPVMHNLNDLGPQLAKIQLLTLLFCMRRVRLV